MTDTFWSLLHDAAHWEFELIVSFVFMVFEGLIFWPVLRKWKKHMKEHV